jgi:3-phosphoshikimate 1-carboxyvinyltransferase
MTIRMAENARESKTFYKSEPLLGKVRVPGDKSITHRAILFGLLAQGTTVVDNWLDAGDCRSSIGVAELLGARITVEPEQLRIEGTGGNLAEPDDVLDCGNSGTTFRLFLGALAARVPFACMTGDASLRRRPMDRVIRPLAAMGARIAARSARYAPLCVSGQPLQGIEYILPVASAQVKSAVLIAGLLANSGSTTVVETVATRDHTEKMLRAFQADIEQSRQGGEIRTTVRPSQLQGTRVYVPGDASSAAFVWAAAALVPGSCVTVQQVGLNPTRTGFLSVLERMGARVRIENVHTVAGEPMGDVTVEAAPLSPVRITAAEIPALIDELPVIAVLSAYAKGTTVVEGASELRVKETDRIRAVVSGLQALGVAARELPDGFAIDGRGEVGGGTVDSCNDHRIAMSFAVAGLAANDPVTVKGWECVAISFPTFLQTLQELGVQV